MRFLTSLYLPLALFSLILLMILAISTCFPSSFISSKLPKIAPKLDRCTFSESSNLLNCLEVLFIARCTALFNGLVMIPTPFQALSCNACLLALTSASTLSSLLLSTSS